MNVVENPTGRHDGVARRCAALFVSALQRSDAPTPDLVAGTIERAVHQFGADGCVRRMAEEYGDNPDRAAERMRWVHQLVIPAPASPMWPRYGPLPRS
jgi:hypothetical protein